MYNQHFMPLTFQDGHLCAGYFPNRNCFHVVWTDVCKIVQLLQVNAANAPKAGWPFCFISSYHVGTTTPQCLRDVLVENSCFGFPGLMGTQY